MLTAQKIDQQVECGRIIISDYNPDQRGPNSYDLTMAPALSVVVPNDGHRINTDLPSKVQPIELDPDGFFELLPGEVYLGHSVEYFGSPYFVPSQHGRSTTARHGILVHLSAGFADLGWVGQIVFEFANLTSHPVLLRPGRRIAQVAFEKADGDIDMQYHSTYQYQRGIVAAKGLGD
jgi:dCTP deaminase